MNEDLTKFLLERISALENQNRELKNINMVKTEQIEALRYELNYSKISGKVGFRIQKRTGTKGSKNIQVFVGTQAQIVDKRKDEPP